VLGKKCILLVLLKSCVKICSFCFAFSKAAVALFALFIYGEYVFEVVVVAIVVVQCETDLSFRLSMLKNVKIILMSYLSLHLAWCNLSIYQFINVCVSYCFVLNSVCYIEYLVMLK